MVTVGNQRHGQIYDSTFTEGGFGVDRAVEIKPDGTQQRASSSMLFWRFRRLVCEAPLSAGPSVRLLDSIAAVAGLNLGLRPRVCVALTCSVRMGAGKHTFGDWTIICNPTTFVCLDIRHAGHAGTQFKLALV